jgi:hypothetical protein
MNGCGAAQIQALICTQFMQAGSVCVGGGGDVFMDGTPQRPTPMPSWDAGLVAVFILGQAPAFHARG